MPELRLPVGTLRTEQDTAPRVDLWCSRTERRRLRDWFDRVAGLGLPWIASPTSISDASGGLTLEYPASLRGSVRADVKCAEWSQDLPSAMPLVLGLARFTLVVSEALTKHRVREALVCPALVHLWPGDSATWCLLPVPASTATLSDWAKAEPSACAWASPAALLAGRLSDPVHTLGAAIHLGILGGMFPDSLHHQEKFSRLLRGRVGMPARLETATRTATPARCQPDAESLRKFVLDCLDSRVGRQPSEVDARSRFTDLETRFSPDRLAKAWDAESRPATGDKLRKQSAPPPPPKPPETTPEVPTPGKDWSDLAREHLNKGEISQALTTAWNALFAEGPHKSDLYLMVVQRAAALSPVRAEIVTALNRLKEAYSPELIGEANLIRAAHIWMRYLAASEDDVYRYLPVARTDWGKAVGALMRAVFAVRRTGAYAETAKFCAEGSSIFAKMPQGGGEVGRYARGYLALLDGVAHVGFVAAGGSPDYYSDALTKFGTALQLAGEVGARDLLRAAVQWLNWLAWLAGLTPGKTATTIRTAAEAMLKLYGGTGPGLGVVETPDVPPYDEAYLFPV